MKRKAGISLASYLVLLSSQAINKSGGFMSAEENLLIVGSLRKESINRKVANAIAELVPASLNAQCPSRDCGNVKVNRSCRN
jgi:hypothetical protein